MPAFSISEPSVFPLCDCGVSRFGSPRLSNLASTFSRATSQSLCRIFCALQPAFAPVDKGFADEKSYSTRRCPPRASSRAHPRARWRDGHDAAAGEPHCRRLRRPALEGCNENLVITRPDVVCGIHRKYLEAGSDIIETNSFGSTPVVLAEYGLGAEARDISRVAAALARKAADEFSTPAKPRFVAGSMGPTTKAISVTGGITFEQLRNNYLRASARPCRRRRRSTSSRDLPGHSQHQSRRPRHPGAQPRTRPAHPVMISVTIEPMGTMLAGQNIEALWASLDHVDVLSLGLNCATGPEFMTDHVRTLQSLTNRFVSCYPNAGLPNEEGLYQETPTSLAEQLDRFVDRGWLNIVGGCCGTTEKHIRAIAQMAEGKKPRRPAGAEPSRRLLRHRHDRSGGKHAAADRRRTHQRDRLAPVQESGRRGTVGRSHRNRSAPGEKRRAHRGRLPAKHRPRRNQATFRPFTIS